MHNIVNCFFFSNEEESQFSFFAHWKIWKRINEYCIYFSIDYFVLCALFYERKRVNLVFFFSQLDSLLRVIKCTILLIYYFFSNKKDTIFNMMNFIIHKKITTIAFYHYQILLLYEKKENLVFSRMNWFKIIKYTICQLVLLFKEKWTIVCSQFSFFVNFIIWKRIF